VKDEKGGHGHTSLSILHQFATWCHDMNTRCFYTSALSTFCFDLSVMEYKIEQHFCIKLCMKHGKSATKTLEILHEPFGEHSISGTAVSECHSCFKAGRVSVEDCKCSWWPSTSKMTENVIKIKKTHPQRPSANNPWSHRQHWDQLWSLPGNLNRKCEHASHCCKVCSPILDKWWKQ
jgi:hypothetical protein